MMKWAWRDDAVVIYQWDDCSAACKVLPGVSWGVTVDFQPGFISWMRQGLIMLIYKAILHKYTTFKQETKVNAWDFMPFLQEQEVTCSSDAVLRKSDKKGYIAVITVWTSHCCVSGWTYGKLLKLHTWCWSHQVKNITTSQEVLFI